MTDVHLDNLRALMRFSQAEIQQHIGEYALFVHGRLQAYFSTNREALKKALETHRFGEFSVLRVDPLPADLGFLDSADYSRETL